MRPQEPCRGTALEELPAPVDAFALAGLPGLRMPQVHTVRGWRVVVADPVTVVGDLRHLDDLGRWCAWRAGAERDVPPFLGGAAGFITDDCSAGFVDLPTADRRPQFAPLPPLCFGVYDSAVCVAPGGERAWLVAADIPALTQRPAAERLAELRRRVTASRPTRPGADRARAPVPVHLSLPPPAHAAAVARVLEWIAAGDLYQLNLTLQAAVPWSDGGLALARRLQAASPGAAHAAYARLPGGVEIVSVSPETFLRTDAERVLTRPIKGTRPRYDDRTRDADAERQLRASEKDHAEHVMIVDLERNDLGRVCVPGSVEVPELAALEGHPTVWHLTSTVTGRLRDDVGLGALLRATFPSGSVTGAPKRMAVARTRLVEPVRRGVYCGTLGAISRGGVDLSVAIRTAVVHQGVASYGTGGAIVADSQPGEEFAEALTKAAAFLRATNAEPLNPRGGGRSAAGPASRSGRARRRSRR